MSFRSNDTAIDDISRHVGGSEPAEDVIERRDQCLATLGRARSPNRRTAGETR